MELPFPKSRSGWFISFILVFISFWYYYNHLYEKIYEYYENQFYAPKVFIDDRGWRVEIQTPKTTSVMAPGWIYGKIYNNSLEDRDVNLSVVLEEETTVLIPSIYKDEVFQRQITGRINGYSSMNFRIQFGNNVVLVDNCSENLKFILNGKKVDIRDALPCPQDDSASDQLLSLKRAIIENLILPPWANTIIPAIVLFFGYLAEKKVDEEKEEQTNIIGVLFIGTYSFFAIWSFYFILSSYLWEPRDNSWIVLICAIWVILLSVPLSSIQELLSASVQMFSMGKKKSDSQSAQILTSFPQVSREDQQNPWQGIGPTSRPAGSRRNSSSISYQHFARKRRKSLVIPNCPGCGRKKDPKDKICPHCGYSFSSD